MTKKTGINTASLLNFAAMNLSESQKKYLRGLGHQKKPLIIVGDAGLSESLLAEYESTLDHHELIKVRVRAAGREERDAIIARLCDGSSAQLVQRIGNVALIYRANLKKQPEKRLRLPAP
jgi:RNA-binding protein